MTTYKSFSQIFALGIALLVLLGYSFIAAWTPPPAGTVPPDNNVPAPINVGPATQDKNGNLAVNILAATTEVRSDRYCDALGADCFETNELSAGKSCPENYYLRGFGINGQPICGEIIGGGASCVFEETSIKWCPGDSMLVENQRSCPTGYRPIGGTYPGANCTQGGEWEVQDCVKLSCGGAALDNDGGTFVYSFGYGGINGRRASCTQINAQTGGCSCPTGYQEVIVQMTQTQGNCSGSQQNCETVPDEKTVACVLN